MIREIDNCVNCGKLPCYHCKTIEYVCDCCGKETDTLYDIGDEFCYDCLKKFIIGNPDEIISNYIRRVEE